MCVSTYKSEIDEMNKQSLIVISNEKEGEYIREKLFLLIVA
jgi:hypothetical protein